MVAAILTVSVAAQKSLTNEQLEEAIALGKSGAVPVVHVGTSRDFSVFIKGPIANIAVAAASATKQFRPFEPKDVPAALKVPSYVVTVLSTPRGFYLSARRIVLQPKGAKGMEGVIQPVKEDINLESTAVGRDATFDRLPDGEFDVVVVTLDGTDRFGVTAETRAKIR